MKKHGSSVLPGEEVAVAEEFISGEGTYDLTYVVRSAYVGRVFYDMMNRRVTVNPVKVSGLQMLKSAKSLTGVVVDYKPDIAFLSIFQIDDRILKTPFSGSIQISQARDRRIDSITQALRRGDIVRGKPMNRSIPVSLTIKSKELGVIQASCSVCGNRMEVLDQEHFKCQNCGSVESRKVAMNQVRRRER